jgi:hypothetical protein
MLQAHRLRKSENAVIEVGRDFAAKFHRHGRISERQYRECIPHRRARKDHRATYLVFDQRVKIEYQSGN